MAELKQLGKDRDIVFFASWCKNCDELLRAASASTILVASFDDKENAEAVLSSYRNAGGLPIPCLFDVREEMADALAVKNLPATRRLH